MEEEEIEESTLKSTFSIAKYTSTNDRTELAKENSHIT